MPGSLLSQHIETLSILLQINKVRYCASEMHVRISSTQKNPFVFQVSCLVVSVKIEERRKQRSCLQIAKNQVSMKLNSGGQRKVSLCSLLSLN